ncbi:uncharacterized protein LOC128552408, partial [Mercenaria mercenaria]|uniref:uncharacterized protein LOC128552408 n=1 Tax=Mercenaria mercenaria TaxID=6596 RepID=UPI00234F938D
MAKIVGSKMLLKDIGKLSPAQQTSSLEAFHKVVCHFAPKFVHYEHPQMEARLCLAALHFNENDNRAQATKKKGTPQYSVSFQRGRETGVAKEVKVEMTYDMNYYSITFLISAFAYKNSTGIVSTEERNDILGHDTGNIDKG